MYDAYLILVGIEHSELVFGQYLNEYGEKICPDHGDISCVDGNVQCSKHDRDEDTGSDDGDVPFL